MFPCLMQERTSTPSVRCRARRVIVWLWSELRTTWAALLQSLRRLLPSLESSCKHVTYTLLSLTTKLEDIYRFFPKHLDYHASYITTTLLKISTDSCKIISKNMQKFPLICCKIRSLLQCIISCVQDANESLLIFMNFKLSGSVRPMTICLI